MNKHIIAGLVLAGSVAAAPAAKALPLIDIGVGAGVLTMEDDSDGAAAVSALVGVNIPATPFGVEGTFTQTISDGSFDFNGGSLDYSGNQLGAFVTANTPTPGIKVKGKLGMVRSDFDFDGMGSASSTDFAFGAAVIFTSWQLEWTRTKVDDGGVDQDIDYISISYVW
ncbi:outer membrane beta-barrel protein [Gammaproteobacteria bacterium AB-CW1]|uniref:Outer membrane beta-barrel protein n=1 Tax=Natronospira elongata TaxID=3110268 RepID=A0AAP6JF55_9GAMM|nr:outer membrane beta-barrel protein [Gammaproteobacteria bacterium AB-CW1]